MLNKKNKEGGLFVDDRGVIRFINDFPSNIKRMYQVENSCGLIGAVRAWHGHLKENKYVYVPRGIVEVKIIKMKKSECHGCFTGYIPDGPADRILTFTLSSFQPSILHINNGYYNGFKTLTDDAIVQFFSTSTLEESKNDDFRLPWDYFGKEVWEENFR